MQISSSALRDLVLYLFIYRDIRVILSAIISATDKPYVAITDWYNGKNDTY